MVYQPAECREPVKWSFKQGKTWDTPRGKAVLKLIDGFDPLPIYQHAGPKLHAYRRIQSIEVKDLFPDLRKDEQRICACGCGRPAKRRYHNEDCAALVNICFEILYGRLESIGTVLSAVFGYQCVQCERHNYSKLQVDHRVAVMNGGGASWLGNFQWLCEVHHKQKTARDLAENKKQKEEIQPDLFGGIV